jgi:GNAT superfamily N-acetyltransferase
MIIRRAEPEDADAIARVQVDTWRSAYADLIPAAVLDGLSYKQRSRYWRGFLSKEARGFMGVAEDSHAGVVGFACCGPNREEPLHYQGQLYAIYVLEEHQRLGIGHQLFEEARKWLSKRALDSMIVWVLRENPYRKFYESLGGELVGERTINVGEAESREVAYGWDNWRQETAEG